ncbi:insulysin [Nematocida sp. AWRm80]|nr:insulysin [Nematocida sp. AWRm80]
MIRNLLGGQDIYSYKTVELENGIRVLLSTNPEADKAAVALSVKAGGYSDPEELPGLAHFLEHMLFMGTEAYPDENDYMSYIHSHNGESNAYTCCEVTNYFFSIDSECLEKCMDMFSGFFRYPLIKQDSLTREVNAVDSEHSRNILLESWRANYLLCLLSDPSMPTHKFQTGSLTTLSKATREDLIKFWKYFYRPSRMCLVVHGKNTLDELEEYVRKYFTSVKDNSSTLKEEYSGYLPPVKEANTLPFYHMQEDAQGKITFYRSAVNINTSHMHLTINLVLPPTYQTYSSQTQAYLCELIEGTGMNSFSGVLLLSGLVSNISLSQSMTSINSIITIKVELTENKMNIIKPILDLLKKYLEMIKENNNKSIYDTYKEIYEMEFKNLESIDPINLVETAAYAMQYYPTESFVRHEYEWNGFDAKEFAEFLEHCLDETKWIILCRVNELDSSKGLKKYTDPAYGINYQIDNIPEGDSNLFNRLKDQLEWKYTPLTTSDISEARANNTHLPLGTIPANIQKITMPQPQTATIDTEANPEQESKSIQETKTSLDSKDQANTANTANLSEEKEKEPSLGRVIASKETEECEAYLVFKEKYNNKECQVVLYLHTDEYLASAKVLASFIGYLNAYIKYFEEKYKLELHSSCASVSSSVSEYTVKIHFEGMPVIIEDLIDKFLNEYVQKDQNLFNLSKETTISKLQSLIKKPPYEHVYRGLDIALGCPVYDLKECIEQAKCLLPEDLVVITKAKLRVLCTGNTTIPEFHRILDTIAKYITPVKYTIPVHNTLKDVFLPTEDPTNKAVCLVHKITPTEDQITNLAIAKILTQIRQETFFDELRTQENFGYVVYAQVCTVLKVPYIFYVVQSSREYSVIHDRITLFIKELPEVLTKLDPEEYITHRASAKASVLEESLNLSDYTQELCRYWNNLSFDLSHKNELAQKIDSLTKDEIISYTNLFSPPTTISILHQYEQ